MSSSIGENLRITLFGQSHSPAVGMTLEGLPAGFEIDMEALGRFLERRAPGRNAWSTPRKEADAPEFLSGLVGNVTCGTPVTTIIRNGNTRSGDYELLRRVPRPGHADFPAGIKYFGHQDVAGGGHFSARLTAGLCVGGGICLQYLEKHGIRIRAHIAAIGGIRDEGDPETELPGEAFPTLSAKRGEDMKNLIAAARAEGDSIGGVVECVALGVPAGLGDPIFGGLENRIAGIVFGIPAVKGVEFGDGFEAARARGSENNDGYRIREGRVRTASNHAGGILGGLSSGETIRFRAAFKPTPSIAAAQESVDLETGEETELRVPGRHDPCVVPRAVPCVEAAAALALTDCLLGRRKETEED